MWDPLTDPGPLPPELLERPLPTVHVTHLSVASGWEAVERVADHHPELAHEIEAARQRLDQPEGPNFQAWIEDLLRRLTSESDDHDVSSESDDDVSTVPHDCVCGREGTVPFAPDTRGVLTCEACGQRWGVVAFQDGGGVIWAVA